MTSQNLGKCVHIFMKMKTSFICGFITLMNIAIFGFLDNLKIK